MKIDILDHGFIRLDAHMADDLSVVNAARVSFGKRVESMSEEDEKLIGFLMRNKHHSPFEHSTFRFHIKCPIFVAREWFRHRIGSFNEISGRYAQLPKEFYVPKEEHVRKQVGKPGNYSFIPHDDGDVIGDFISGLDITSKIAYEEYENAIENGIAKEIARLYLPVNIYTEFYWTVNARALMNFLSLRNADDAQYEIRVYAESIDSIFSEKMPVSAKAFKEYNEGNQGT